MKTIRFISCALIATSMVASASAQAPQYQQQYPSQQGQYQQQYPPQQGQYQQQYPQQQPQQYQQYPQQQAQYQQYPPQQPQYQQYPPQYQQYPPQSLTPEQMQAQILYQEQMRMAQEDPCRYLADQWTDNDIRAYGQGSGFDKEAAYRAAVMNAEGALNQIMNGWAQDWAERTAIETQKNDAYDAERVTKLRQIRFAEGDLKGAKVLLSKYENANRGVVCKVCLTINVEAAKRALLNQAQVNEAVANSAALSKYADESIEKIRFDRTGTNREIRMKELEHQRQMQMQQQQNQHDLEMQKARSQAYQSQQTQQNQHDLEMQKVISSSPNASSATIVYR